MGDTRSIGGSVDGSCTQDVEAVPARSLKLLTHGLGHGRVLSIQAMSWLLLWKNAIKECN